MKDITIKISIIVYSLINLIYCLVFLLTIGTFIIGLYYNLIKQLIF